MSGPLSAIGAASYANAKTKGFYDELDFARACLRGASYGMRVTALLENLWLLARSSLIVSEVSEMVECVRDGELAATATPAGKPEGLPSEMADVIIRLADLAHANGIDLDSAVAAKMAYNATRPVKHGRKEGL